MTIYLFGSRVRSDNRANSDVDIYIDTGNPSDQAVWWFMEQEKTGYAELKALLPGPLGLLDREDSEMAEKVVSGQLVHSDRNVKCVWMPAKMTGK